MSLSRIDRVSANVGRFVAAYSIAVGPVECGWEPLEPGILDDIKFFVRVAVAIEDAVTVATRPKEKFPDGEADVQPEAHGVAEDDE